MVSRVMIILVFVMSTLSIANAQIEGYTPETDLEILRLIRNEKLDLILPGAMRDNNVDMWIHVTRKEEGLAADKIVDPMDQHFGSTGGYLIFTDLGDRIERAMFGGIFGRSAVENIDIYGSREVGMALDGYNYNNLDPRQIFTIPEVYDEITEFVAERDPKTIAVNFSDWLPAADGISHTQYLKLGKILGPKYSQRIVSAENVITDFIVRKTSREIAAQTHTLVIARQRALEKLRSIVPGKTTIGEVGGRIYYSFKSKRIDPPNARWWINHPDYVYQRGDFFAFGVEYSYLGFVVDTKIHAYILREGETEVPESIQYAWDQGKKAQEIIRKHVKVGMTAGESLKAIVAAMEEAGYTFTPFTDVGTEDYKEIQVALADTDKSGFYLDLHAHTNTGDIGPSISAFRPDTHHLTIQENHIFAFEYAVHTNLSERPGYPISINFSNPQIVTSRGVEWIQPSNDEIILIH